MKYYLRLFFIIFSLSVFSFSCGGNEDDSADADSLADEGFNEIAIFLSDADLNRAVDNKSALELMNFSKFEGAVDKFEKALKLDSENPAANFGMGIASVLELFYSGLQNLSRENSGIYSGFSIADAAELRLLPALDKAEIFLVKGLGLDRTIEVVFRGRTLELDRTEVYFSLAGINLVKAGVNALLAYNTGIVVERPAELLFNPLSLIDEQLKNEDYLTLKEEGRDLLETSRGSLACFLEYAGGGYDYLISESGSQENDLIKMEYFSFMEKIEKIPGGTALLDKIAEKVLFDRLSLIYFGIPAVLDLPVFFEGGLADLKDFFPYYRFNGIYFELLDGPADDPLSQPVGLTGMPYFPDYSFGGILDGMTREGLIKLAELFKSVSQI